MIAKLQAFVESKDWMTWVSHVVMAGVLGAVATLLFEVPLVNGMLMGCLAYWWREAEQVWDQGRREGWDVVQAHALDHMMDFGLPFLVFAAVFAFA